MLFNNYYASTIKTLFSQQKERNAMHIRQAQLSDLPIIKNILHQSVKHYLPLVYQPEVIDYFLDYHNDQSISKGITDGYTLLAFQDNIAVATANITNNYVGGMYVLPGYTRHKLGSCLIKEILAYAEKANLNRVWLEATLGSEEFYLSLGFTMLATRYTPMENNMRLYYFDMEKHLNY